MDDTPHCRTCMCHYRAKVFPAPYTVFTPVNCGHCGSKGVTYDHVKKCRAALRKNSDLYLDRLKDLATNIVTDLSD